MRVTVLGSGAAFTPHGFPSATVLDGRLLIDCGAPVHVLAPRAGIDVGGISTVLLTHFHADHCFQLPMLLGARALAEEPRPLRLAGPAGTHEYVTRMLRLGYGSDLVDSIEAGIGLDAVILQDGSDLDIDGYRVRAHAVVHSTGPSLAYAVTAPDGVTVALSGDSRLCAGLHRALDSADIAVVECTGWHAPVEGNHLWREDIRALTLAHPDTRLVLSHLHDRGTLIGALVAHDGLTLEVTAGGLHERGVPAAE